MRIAITGARSDIARNIQLLAADSGDSIMLAPPSEELNFLNSQGKLAIWLDRCAPDAVIHLAGSKPPATVETLFANNVAATYNLLEAMGSESSAATFILASSSAVYGQLAADETAGVRTTVRPVNAYGYSKAAQEDVAFRACHAAGRRLTVARVFNVVGAPSDTYSVLPSLVQRSLAVREHGSIVVRDGNCVRDFVDIVDVAAAILLACRSNNAPKIMNVCSELPVTIMSLASLVARRIPKTIEFVFEQGEAPDTIVRSVGDASEARALGWEPRHSLEKTIDETILRMEPGRRCREEMPIAPEGIR